MNNLPKFRIHFRLSIIITVALIVLILTTGIFIIVFTTSMNSARNNMNTLFIEIGARAQEKIENQMNMLMRTASMGAAIEDFDEEISGTGINHSSIVFMKQCLDQHELIYSVYYGKENGNFIQLIKTNGNPDIIQTHNAPDATMYILRSIVDIAGTRVQHWTFLDSGWSVLDQQDETTPDYDPRERPWYSTSLSVGKTMISEAYLFNSLQQLGITASKQMVTGTGVFGVDMTLQDLNNFMEEGKPSENGGLFLIDQQDRILAATPELMTLFKSEFVPLCRTPDLLQNFLEGNKYLNNEEYLSSQTVWNDGTDNLIQIVILSPLSDFTKYLIDMRAKIILFSTILLTVLLGFSIIILRKLTAILFSLADDAERVKQFDFTGEIPMDSFFIEIHKLAEGFHHMKQTIGERTEELESAKKKLEKIVELGIAMASEKDVNRLVELILLGSKELSNSDGGSVYLKNSTENLLDFKIVLNDTLGFIQGGTSGTPITLPSVPLLNPDGSPNHHNVVTHCFHTGETVNIEDAYNNDFFDFSGTKKFDEGNNYVSHSFLTIPLKPRGGEVLGALQLINAKDINNGSNISFSTEIQRFVEALSASAATSLYNRDLLETQHKLFDSMIEFTAGAIDAKSRYTGGHCSRVPKIALMLSEEAHKLKEGPLADFQLNNPDDWRELRIGAWLHDCGKMTSPEFVVDKATKLETITNRIHEIRTRFEILLRDAEIDSLKLKINGIDSRKADLQYSKREEELQKDFKFIAECNSGDKFIEAEDIERIKKIGAQNWIRHFDDKLGLSWEELSRISTGNAPDGPAVENLLSDKPEHLIKRDFDLVSDYTEYNLELPEYLYNRGEIYNLTIPRGTLTPEERFKINEHVIQTITMLENLPLPDSMKKVPQYAGTHHEAMNGKGYPRGLTSAELSIPARIMAIADIFEALTASDRPYKKIKTLSECIRILYFFKKDEHIDPHLFDLFLTSGIYKKYADEFLKPEQIDEVDITEYTG